MITAKDLEVTSALQVREKVPSSAIPSPRCFPVQCLCLGKMQGEKLKECLLLLSMFSLSSEHSPLLAASLLPKLLLLSHLLVCLSHFLTQYLTLLLLVSSAAFKVSSSQLKEVECKSFHAVVFHSEECLPFSIDKRPSHHQSITALSKGDGKEGKKTAALVGFGATSSLQSVMSQIHTSSLPPLPQKNKTK